MLIILTSSAFSWMMTVTFTFLLAAYLPWLLQPSYCPSFRPWGWLQREVLVLFFLRTSQPIHLTHRQHRRKCQHLKYPLYPELKAGSCANQYHFFWRLHDQHPWLCRLGISNPVVFRKCSYDNLWASWVRFLLPQLAYHERIAIIIIANTLTKLVTFHKNPSMLCNVKIQILQKIVLLL